MPKNPLPAKIELKELRLEVLVKMTDLAVAGFGLVAALAWNDSIKALFNKFLPLSSSGGVLAQISYATLVTAIVVYITIKLGKMTNVAKEELESAKLKESGKKS